jgi:hypothetical protein
MIWPASKPAPARLIDRKSCAARALRATRVRYRRMLEENKANRESFIPRRDEADHAWTACTGYLSRTYIQRRGSSEMEPEPNEPPRPAQRFRAETRGTP